MSFGPALPPRRGRRDNGLDASAYTSLGDVDPRVGEHLLDVLRDAGIAAYLEPHSELNPYWRAMALPSPPRDRLFVDRTCDERAADLVTEHAEEPDPDPRPGGGADAAAGEADPDVASGAQRGVEPGTHSAVDDAVWAELVAAFERDVDGTERRWPEAEDLPRGPGGPDARPTGGEPARSVDPLPVDDWADNGADLLEPPADPGGWDRGQQSDGPNRSDRRGRAGPRESPDPPGSVGSGPAGFVSSGRPDSAGSSDAPDLSDLPSLDGEPATDPDEHYQPPPPPPFPTPSAATVRAVALLLAGVVMLVAPTLLGIGAETGFVIGVLGIVSGLGLLIFRMRERPPTDDGDNGAVV